MDCAKGKDGLHGCHSRGGLVAPALEAIKRLGIYRAVDYPWINDDQRCKKIPRATVFYKNSRFTVARVESKEDFLQRIENGSLAAYVYVDEDPNTPWHNLKSSGVLSVACSNKQPKHAVLIVGCGNLDGTNYYLIKNSWGRSFGVNGYGKISAERKHDSCIQLWNYIY